MSTRESQIWDEAEAWEGTDPEVSRFHVELNVWVYNPGTWPNRSEHEGSEGFCIGSPGRFRIHEFIDGSCRWCSRVFA